MAAHDSVSITGTGGPHAPSPRPPSSTGESELFRAWIDTLWTPASAPEWPDDVVMPDTMHVVAIEMVGKYRVDAAINSRNLIQRFKITVNIEFSDFVAVFEALGDEARSLHAAVESEGSQSTSAGYERSRPRLPVLSRAPYRERGRTPADGRRQEPHTAARRYNAGERAHGGAHS